MNKYIDHTNLKAYATIEDITKLCEEAIKYNFKTVCVHPYYISLAKDILKDTSVEVCTVIGFPLGMNSKETKVYEAIDAVSKGADEIDMVINIGALKDKEYGYVKSEIEEKISQCGTANFQELYASYYAKELTNALNQKWQLNYNPFENPKINLSTELREYVNALENPQKLLRLIYENMD